MKKTILFIIPVFFTTQMFAQWTSLNSGTNEWLRKVFFTSDDTGFVLTESGKLLKTINGGANWTFIQNQPSYYFSLSFPASDSGYVLLYNGYVNKTTNGGNSWSTIYMDSTIDFEDIFFPSKTTGYAVGYNGATQAGACYKSTNSGISWTAQNLNITVSQRFNSTFFITPDTGFVTDEYQIEKTSDGGLTWIPSVINNISTFWDIYFTSKDTGYVCGTSGYIGKTVNGGVTWNQLALPSSYPYYGIFFISADTGFAVGGNGFSGGTIVQTNDAGNTWSLVPGLIQTFSDVYFPSSNIGYAVGTNGTIMKYQAPVGIDEYDDNIFSLFPNPATNHLTISLKYPAKKTNIIITDLTGKIIYKTTVTQTQKIEVNTKNFSEGVYIVQILHEESYGQTGEFIETKKLVVAR